MSDPQRAEMPTWECYDLLAGCSVGRLCFMDRDTPIAYPVSFKLHRTDSASYVVVRTGPRSLIAAHAGPASFEVDEIDVASHTAWSVLLRGTLRRIHDSTNLPSPEPWVVDGTHVWMQLEIASVSGRRFVSRDVGDGFSVEWEIDRQR